MPNKRTAVPLFQVDAFAEQLFSGNPAAVCLLDEAAPVAWMQALATEMNLSETAYVRPLDDGFELRWFTPAFEVDLCGHATLASASILWSKEYVAAAEDIVFHTHSGALTIHLNGDWIVMDFPAEAATARPVPEGLLQALGVEGVWVGANRMDWLVEIRSPLQLRSLTPNYVELARLLERGVIVTCISDDDRYDFLSRFFAPAVGVNEDPVTGSAHCCLAPYWASSLQKNSLVGFQASPRGGVVGVEVVGDRVLLKGRAVQVFETTVAVAGD